MSQDVLTAHQAAWARLAQELADGTALLPALRSAATHCGHARLNEALQTVAADVESGATLSGAMGRCPEVFSPVTVAVIAAAEVGGVLDLAVGHLSEALAKGACRVPGVEPTEDDETQRYWRLLGLMLSSGLPVIQALDLLCEDTADPGLRVATRAMRQRIAEGSSLGEEMGLFPDVFDGPIVAAVRAAQEHGELDRQALAIAEALEAGDTARLASGLTDETATERQEVAAFANDLLRKGGQCRASDIHIEPTEDGRGRIRLRIDGVLQQAEPIPEHLFQALVGRLKTMAGMDAAERRLPQRGRMVLQELDRTFDFRVSTLPSLWGERAVIRLMDREAIQLRLDQIMRDDDLELVRALCHQRWGLVICSGPTGSGKTTLLYGILYEIDRESHCVVSVEDPVEFTLEGVTQIPVQPEIGFTFPAAVRAVLSQDPDVIMVGEVLDYETLHLAAVCAQTGHLVFTTLHTSTAAETVKRLLDMGLPPMLVNGTLSAVIAQRLVRCLCPECKAPADPPELTEPPEAVDFLRSLDEASFYKAVGCEACHNTGYRRRMAIHEILLMKKGVPQAIAAAADADALHEAAVASGMKTLLVSGLEAAARGITSVEEVLRVASRSGP